MQKCSFSFLYKNSLSLVVFSVFLLLWIGQGLSGWLVHNEDLMRHKQMPISFLSYLQTPHFREATSENWESEFLQMGFYVVLTVFLRQKGSAESKSLEKEEKVDRDPRKDKNKQNAPWPVRQGGWTLKIYEHSLGSAFLLLFLISFFWHAISGHALENEERSFYGQPIISLWEFIFSSSFWFQSFQNWQSEFLAVLSIVLLSIWLREKGSPESKPVSAPHSETGE